MNILFLEQAPRHVGGSERMTLLLCRHALTRGHACHLAHAEDGDLLPEFESAGARIHRVPLRPLAARHPLAALRAIRSVLALVRRERIDAIVSCLVSHASLLAVIGRLARVKTVLHLGVVFDFSSPLFRLSIRHVDHGIAPAAHIAVAWRKRGWPGTTLSTVPNGIASADFSPAADRPALRTSLGCPESVPMLVYVGRLVAEKGVFTLLRAFISILETHPDARLIFVGAPSAREDEELRALAATPPLSANAVSVLPPTSRPERFYQAADLVIVPSEWDEPFGLVPLEAAACGAPILVSDRGVLPTFVAPVGEAAVFRAGDAGALAAKIRRWLDRDDRPAIGARLRRHVLETFPAERCGDAYLALIDGSPDFP